MWVSENEVVPRNMSYKYQEGKAQIDQKTVGILAFRPVSPAESDLLIEACGRLGSVKSNCHRLLHTPGE
jgi:hypothetical protein